MFDRVGYLSGAGSDYAAFVHYLGITSMDFSYTYDRVRPKHCMKWNSAVVLCCFVLRFYVDEKKEQSEAM